MVIFGITGDLARKMIFRGQYRLERRGPLNCPIIGVGRLSHLHGEVSEDSRYQQLATQVGHYDRALFSLEKRQVAVRKPFVRDLASARELKTHLHWVLRERQILRVDHFLGKGPVIEQEYLRFANLAMAEIWDRKSVSCIQITTAENFGVTDRGAFYELIGALRDVVQNHLLQVLALVAREPPAGASADERRDTKIDVFTAMPAADPQQCVGGQYAGYTDVTGVAPGSRSCPPTPRSRPTRSCCGSTPTRAYDYRCRPSARSRGDRFTSTPCSPKSSASRYNPTNGYSTPPWPATPKPHLYSPGSWGPTAAKALVGGHPGRQPP